MTHFVLYARRRTVSADELDRISGTEGVTILDDDVRGALLVDAQPESADRLRKLLPGWVVAEEVEYPPPGLKRHSIKRDEK